MQLLSHLLKVPNLRVKQTLNQVRIKCQKGDYLKLVSIMLCGLRSLHQILTCVVGKNYFKHVVSHTCVSWIDGSVWSLKSASKRKKHGFVEVERHLGHNIRLSENISTNISEFKNLPRRSASMRSPQQILQWDHCVRQSSGIFVCILWKSTQQMVEPETPFPQ